MRLGKGVNQFQMRSLNEPFRDKKQNTWPICLGNYSCWPKPRRDFTAKTDSTFETEQRLKWKKKKIKNAVPIHFFPRKATFDEKKIFIISTAVRRIHLSIHKTTWWCKNKQNYKKTAGPRFRHTFTISENWVERNWKTERWGLQPYQTHLQRSKPCRRQNRSWQLFFLSSSYNSKCSHSSV